MNMRLTLDTERRRLTQLKDNYLKKNVFQGLKAHIEEIFFPDIPYFEEDEFEIVLQRIKALGLSIYGIEPWLNGEFYDVEGYWGEADDSNWYFACFEKFKKLKLPLRYSASYHVPESKLIEK